jgi:imidazolonepropionase-like amidohydrolase
MNRLIISAAALFIVGIASAQDVAVKGGIVHTSDGNPITNGVVIVKKGKISAVGSADRVRIPTGMTVIEAAVVTPGLIDAHSVVGLAGYYNQSNDQDQLEQSEAIQPELRAIDAYNAREVLVSWLREHGVTTIHTGHGPGEIISGQTMITKTTGMTVDDGLVRAEAMVAATLGEGAVVSGAGGRKSPGNRSKAIAMLRAELIKAREYSESIAAADKDDEKDAPPRNLRMDALSSVLAGKTPLLVTVHRHNDILTALRIADEFEFRIILDGATESYLVIDEIKAAGADVIIHPAMTRAWGEKENLSFTTANTLINAGINVAFQSGYESYVPKTRVVLFEAAINVQYGMPFATALESMTIEAAKILGIDDRVGSIKKGKDGDLALFDGDPFEYTSHVTGVVIDGKLVSDTVR